MPWRNGRYIPRTNNVALEENSRTSITNESVRSEIRRTSLKSENFNNNFFDATFISRVFAAGSFTAAFLSRVAPKSLFSSKSGLRSLFEPGFVDSSLIADGAVVGSKISNPFRVALIDGDSAGIHTVSGIGIRDELIAVLEQNGTSGILTNLSTEFSIKTENKIDNSGGTDTSNDKLLVFYLSK